MSERLIPARPSYADQPIVDATDFEDGDAYGNSQQHAVVDTAHVNFPAWRAVFKLDVYHGRQRQ